MISSVFNSIVPICLLLLPRMYQEAVNITRIKISIATMFDNYVNKNSLSMIMVDSFQSSLK